MNKLKIVLAVGALTATAATAPLVSAGGQHHNNPCSVRGIAGKWLFATDIGHFAGTDTIPRGDITAAGTMNIDTRGNVSGTFDAVIQEVAFLPGETYSGSVQVNDNCTGHAALRHEPGHRTQGHDSHPARRQGNSRDVAGSAESLDVHRAKGPAVATVK